jgi:hypothetical protein
MIAHSLLVGLLQILHPCVDLDPAIDGQDSIPDDPVYYACFPSSFAELSEQGNSLFGFKHE